MPRSYFAMVEAACSCYKKLPSVDSESEKKTDLFNKSFGRVFYILILHYQWNLYFWHLNHKLRLWAWPEPGIKRLAFFKLSWWLFYLLSLVFKCRCCGGWWKAAALPVLCVVRKVDHIWHPSANMLMYLLSSDVEEYIQ